ncbi:ribosome maturation factor RimP [Actinomyces polynesiensis]|uniref:ribosome maturation factor RimP n=1 Tax=Actinomyces polynesiensis TaxID=1325934 RepID=UPI0005BC3182|nr:ribosome maturation factor RimP [Actinomyces polynesiensis]
MASPREPAALRPLLEGVVAGAGLALDSVVELHQNGTAVVRVVVDVAGDDGEVDSDTLAEVSRAVSKAMDAADPIDGEYVLEVSTPGAERELTLPRHWRRALGRLVRIRLREGGTLTGRLREVGEDTVTVEVDGEPTTIALGNVKKARPRVEFGSEE